jgi:hypothetical protein
MDLRALRHPPDAREAAALDEGLVERLVQDVERVRVLRGIRGALPLDVLLEPLQVRVGDVLDRPSVRLTPYLIESSFSDSGCPGVNRSATISSCAIA